MQNKTAEVEFFNKFGSENTYDVFTETGYDKLLSEFIRLVKPKAGEVFGDFGCGSGAVTWRVQKKFGLKAYGLDLSDKMIEANRKKFPDIDFRTQDIENTDFEPNSFDIIAFSGVLHHFPNFEAVSKEAFRVLKPGGRVFAFDPNYYNPFMWLYRDDASPVSSKKGRTENERLLTREELKNVFTKVGFKDTQVKAVSGIGFSYLESNLGRRLLPVYNFFDSTLENIGLGQYIGAFLITSAKKV